MPKKQNNLDPIIKTTLRIPESLLKRAKIRGIEDGQPLQDVIVTALEQYLKQKGGR
jgi:predicted DNA binding CopG/RHH family protein